MNRDGSHAYPQDFTGWRMMWAGYWWVVRSDFGEVGVRMERLRGGVRPTGQFQNVERRSVELSFQDGRLVRPATVSNEV